MATCCSLKSAMTKHKKQVKQRSQKKITEARHNLHRYCCYIDWHGKSLDALIVREPCTTETPPSEIIFFLYCLIFSTVIIWATMSLYPSLSKVTTSFRSNIFIVVNAYWYICDTQNIQSWLIHIHKKMLLEQIFKSNWQTWTQN